MTESCQIDTLNSKYLCRGVSVMRILLFILVSILALNFAAADVKTVKQAAEEAITEIFMKRNPDAIDKYVVDNYIQHQPGLPNGRKPFKA